MSPAVQQVQRSVSEPVFFFFFPASTQSASESELSNMFSCETILPRNLEGEKHSSKQKWLCVSYYSWINRWLAAVLTSLLLADDVLITVDEQKNTVTVLSLV